MTYATMTKDELRTACKAAGIAYGKLNNDAMRAALTAAAPQPKPEYLEHDDRPEDDNIPGSYPDIEPMHNSETRNGVTCPRAGGKCRAVWDALDGLAAAVEQFEPNVLLDAVYAPGKGGLGQMPPLCRFTE